MNEEDLCPICGGVDDCPCMYQCDDCDGWHISQEVMDKLGITEADLELLKMLDEDND